MTEKLDAARYTVLLLHRVDIKDWWCNSYYFI